MNSYFGLSVIVSPDQPRMQLSQRVCEVLTPAMIEDHNAWLLKFFGTTNLVQDGQVYKTANSLYMNPRTYEQLKNGRS